MGTRATRGTRSRPLYVRYAEPLYQHKYYIVLWLLLPVVLSLFLAVLTLEKERATPTRLTYVREGVSCVRIQDSSIRPVNFMLGQCETYALEINLLSDVYQWSGKRLDVYPRRR